MLVFFDSDGGTKLNLSTFAPRKRGAVQREVQLFIEGFVWLKIWFVCSKKELKKVLDKWKKGLPLPNFRLKKAGGGFKRTKEDRVH